MEQNSTQQIIAERLKELPPKLRSFLVSEEFSRKLHLVARKYRFDERKETLFENEVTYVLLVLDSVDNLAQSFQDALGMDAFKAADLAADVKEYLLESVIEYLALTEADLIIDDEGTEEEKRVRMSVTEDGTQVEIEGKAEQGETPSGEGSEMTQNDTADVNVSEAPSPHLEQKIESNTLRASGPVFSGPSHLDPQPQGAQPQHFSEEPLTKEHILSQIENPPRTVIKKYVIEHETIVDPAHLIGDTVEERPKLQDHYADSNQPSSN